MEFLSIQRLMKQSINFSQFELNTLEEEEKEMLVLNLQSKIVKNERFERMLTNEKLNNIFTILNGEESYMKREIITEIKNLGLVSVFTKINQEKLDTFQIIKKYLNDIKGLLTCELELSNKYVIIYIQYLLSNEEYDIEDIKKIIKRTKEIYEMTQEVYLADIEAELFALDIEDEKQELEIEQELCNLISGLNLEKELAEEEVLYVSKLDKYDEIVALFRNGLQVRHNMRTFLERLAAPFLSDNPQIVSVDLIQLLLERVVKDNEITEGLKGYILQEIVNFITYKQ